MNALDSPLEALAFNYLSYTLLTVVNNIWTWVAVLTAALSFWRIKVSSSSSAEHPRVKIPDVCTPVKLIPSPVKMVSAEPAELPEPASSFSYKATSLFRSFEREDTTKGKFTLYYEYEVNDDGLWKDGDNYNDEDEGECDGDGDRACGVVKEGWWDRWEKVMTMKMGYEEWYSYQDLTVINGNVVRLWDDCRRL